jgi:hypothetical protein
MRIRSPRLIRLLDNLEAIARDPAVSPSDRIAASTLIALTLDVPVDVLIPMNWRDSLIRVRRQVRRKEAAHRQGQRKVRKDRNVMKALKQIRQIESEESR